MGVSAPFQHDSQVFVGGLAITLHQSVLKMGYYGMLCVVWGDADEYIGNSTVDTIQLFISCALSLPFSKVYLVRWTQEEKW